MNTSIEDIERRADETIMLHHAYVDEILHLNPPKSVRTSVILDCFLLSTELHVAIGTLVKFRHFAAAFALLRPLIETTLRAAWLTYVADYKSLMMTIENKSTNDLDYFARALLKRTTHLELHSIANTILDNRHIYHSLTHCGLEQLARRREGFKRDDLISGLITADAFAIISGEVAHFSNKECKFREITIANAFRLAKENYLRTGLGEEPPETWTGELPEPPSWNDPE